MDATDLAFAGIARQAELIRRRRVSSRELVELYLERIERLDPQLNAFRRCSPSRRSPRPTPPTAGAPPATTAPLLGVPIAIKDDIDVEGGSPRYGTGAFDDARRPPTPSGHAACARPAR